MTRFRNAIESGHCGRCGTPWLTVPYGGVSNFCPDCYDVRVGRIRAAIDLVKWSIAPVIVLLLIWWLN